ncbi:hypothetical protein [Spirosoma sordidisoli]|uniref:Glycosyl transferase n=1 Tax=Spirosoma sordidisoli TaxID=2502893 RepID=A0A4Q2UMU7_9BACT|nr:hypothetical protein [Spirosoma sordidisoli]RYC70626.1 hypothetical protein EQG79_00295 [Spirosoma sordidisoli]
MLLTLCTIRQLPQAIALGDSFSRHALQPNGQPMRVLIGLVDDPARLPADFVSPYPLLPVGEVLPAEQLTALSAKYTPTEFAAACKPHVIAHVFRHFPDADQLIYADSAIQFMGSVTPVWEALANATILLTPHITRSPASGPQPGGAWPDEKYFQNIGLYSADFLAFRRSAETDRFLAWWQDRVTERAYIDFCAGLCTDQIWLMHVPVFFRDVVVVKNPGWHLALWNLPERSLQSSGTSWLVTDPTGQNQPLVFVNLKGLSNPNEGFFPHQNRVKLAHRSDIQALLTACKSTLSARRLTLPEAQAPAYGQQPEPVVLRGWKRSTVKSLRLVTRFLDQIPLPAIR